MKRCYWITWFILSLAMTLAAGGCRGDRKSTGPLVSTVAGSATSMGFADGIGAAAQFGFSPGITTDGVNFYVADAGNNTIRKIDVATRKVITVAGTAGVVGAADGKGTSALFNSPAGITTDGTDLYVADSNNFTIRKIVIASGEVSTIAGKAGQNGLVDGIGDAARFSVPQGITTDGASLYVADSRNNTIRKIVPSTGEVTTVAGSAAVGSSDGIGAAAGFFSPSGITTDGTSLYVADCGNSTIRKIVLSSGRVTTLAGTAEVTGAVDGAGTAALFNWPHDLTNDGTSLYVSDTLNATIRKIVISSGEVATLAGSAGPTETIDGEAAVARFRFPWGITMSGPNLYVTDAGAIREISRF